MYGVFEHSTFLTRIRVIPSDERDPKPNIVRTTVEADLSIRFSDVDRTKFCAKENRAPGKGRFFKSDFRKASFTNFKARSAVSFDRSNFSGFAKVIMTSLPADGYRA
jgi:hypothetical protein